MNGNRRGRSVHAGHLALGVLGLVAALSWAVSCEQIAAEVASQVTCLKTLPGHARTIYGIAFSLDGRYFGSSTLDGVVQLWDCSTWQVVQEFATSGLASWRLSFFPSGTRLMSGNGTVWNIATGQIEFSLGRGHYACLSSDGAWMAAFDDGRRTIGLWSTEDWHLEREFMTGCSGSFVALSPDGRLIALAANEIPDGQDLAVKVFDVESGEQLLHLQGHRSIVHGLAFSPDGRLVGAACMDKTVRLWDVDTGALVRTLPTEGELFDLAFSPDGSLVLAAVNNATVELWSTTDGQRVRILQHGGEVVSLAFSPDSALLACGAYDARIYLWGIRE